MKALDLIAANPRAPTAGAPYAYVTTKRFLEVFGLASPRRDLPDIEKLEDAGLLRRLTLERGLDGLRDDREAFARELDEETCIRAGV